MSYHGWRDENEIEMRGGDEGCFVQRMGSWGICYQIGGLDRALLIHRKQVRKEEVIVRTYVWPQAGQ